jgi:hypothetical protein
MKKIVKSLTGKYGAHKMALIRKRLKVEMWMHDHLQKLYSSEASYSFIFLTFESSVFALVPPGYL